MASFNLYNKKIMRIVLFMIVAVLLTACSVTDDDRARKLIDAYMKKNANDPSSVEIIEVEKVQPDSANVFSSTALYSFLTDEKKSLEKLAKEMRDDGCDDCYDEFMKQAKEKEQEIEQHSIDFKPFFRKQTVIHYRAKNAIGALVKSTARVKFDKDMTEIITFEDIND